jgi:hypothetical protein
MFEEQLAVNGNDWAVDIRLADDFAKMAVAARDQTPATDDLKRYTACITASIACLPVIRRLREFKSQSAAPPDPVGAEAAAAPSTLMHTATEDPLLISSLATVCALEIDHGLAETEFATSAASHVALMFAYEALCIPVRNVSRFVHRLLSRPISSTAVHSISGTERADMHAWSAQIQEAQWLVAALSDATLLGDDMPTSDYAVQVDALYTLGTSCLGVMAVLDRYFSWCSLCVSPVTGSVIVASTGDDEFTFLHVVGTLLCESERMMPNGADRLDKGTSETGGPEADDGVVTSAARLFACRVRSLACIYGAVYYIAREAILEAVWCRNNVLAVGVSDRWLAFIESALRDKGYSSKLANKDTIPYSVSVLLACADAMLCNEFDEDDEEEEEGPEEEEEDVPRKRGEAAVTSQSASRCDLDVVCEAIIRGRG